MLRKGLLEEVTGLVESGAFVPETPASLAIGYRQVLQYLLRSEPVEADSQALRRFLQSFGTASRNYAVSQMHWFIKEPALAWLAADPRDPQGVAKSIAQLSALPRAAFDSYRTQDGSLREAQMSQGASMAGFASRLDEVRLMNNVVVAELLSQADLCTNRIPEHIRSVPEPSPCLLHLPRAGAVPFAKVYWLGRHRTWGWGNPLGKLHKQGIQLLESYGWRRVDEGDTQAVPVFCWCTRKAADFPASGSCDSFLPLIRPFPQDVTDQLDDKGLLAAHLEAANLSQVSPPTWAAEAFHLNPPHMDGPWFLKHVRGVKGNAVHLFEDVAAVTRRLESLGRGREHFVVQRAVRPPALVNGRKYVVRVHAVLHASDIGVAAYCHENMVVLDHGTNYTPDTSSRAAHISSAAPSKHCPKPRLLDDKTLATQVHALVACTFAAVLAHVPRGPLAPANAELCSVFGLDIVTDSSGQAWLIEVNSYPAIASGTMAGVDPVIYTELVRDLLKLVVLPCLDSSTPAGRFVRLDIEHAVLHRADSM